MTRSQNISTDKRHSLKLLWYYWYRIYFFLNLNWRRHIRTLVCHVYFLLLSQKSCKQQATHWLYPIAPGQCWELVHHVRHILIVETSKSISTSSQQRKQFKKRAYQHVKNTPWGPGWMRHWTNYCWPHFLTSSIQVSQAQNIHYSSWTLHLRTYNIYLMVNTVEAREFDAVFLKRANHVLCTVLTLTGNGAACAGILMVITAVWLFSRKSMVGIFLVLCLLPCRKP